MFQCKSKRINLGAEGGGRGCESVSPVWSSRERKPVRLGEERWKMIESTVFFSYGTVRQSTGGEKASHFPVEIETVCLRPTVSIRRVIANSQRYEHKKNSKFKKDLEKRQEKSRSNDQCQNW